MTAARNVEYLPFRLEDWSRVIWASAAAKAHWGQIIQNVNGAWLRMERWAVVEGARSSCLTFFEPSYLPEATQWATRHGLLLLPLAQVGVSDQYSATPKAVRAGRPWQYRAVLTRDHVLAEAWMDAWRDTGQGGRYAGTNNRRLGELLGYPPCCIDFFEREWVEQGRVDVMWASAQNTQGVAPLDVPSGAGVKVPADTPWEANTLLRWLGVRLVPHLPCAFDCAGTVQNARRMMEVGRARGFGVWVDAIAEMLQWPAEWSARHGIAEVRTPVLTVSTRTDATAQTAVVRRESAAPYPEHGASGLHFPYRVVRDKSTGTRAAHRAFAALDARWTLNGFGSEEAMEEAHLALVRVVPDAWHREGGEVLDLGCGTGALLDRYAQRGAWSTFGVELDPLRAAHIQGAHAVGSIFATALWERSVELILCMPGRWLEGGVTAEQAEQARRALLTRTRRAVFYAYGDWLKKYPDGLLGLMREAGLQLPGLLVVNAESAEGVAAVAVEWGDEAIAALDRGSAA